MRCLISVFTVWIKYSHFCKWSWNKLDTSNVTNGLVKLARIEDSSMRVSERNHGQIESIIDVQWRQGNPNLWSTVQGGNEAYRVFHWNGGPEVHDFPVDTEHQWSLLFLTYHWHIRMTPLYLNMEVSEVNQQNKKFQQSQFGTKIFLF